MTVNYSKDIPIDGEALDLEWLNQPELEMSYIEQVSELRKDMMDAQEQVKIIRSELIREAHENPEKTCNTKKATGPQVEAYYRTHKDYKEAKEEAIETQDAYEVAKDMKDMVHFTRSKALENMVILHGQQYFAGPSIPQSLNRREAEKIQKKQRAKKRDTKVAKGMRRAK